MNQAKIIQAVVGLLTTLGSANACQISGRLAAQGVFIPSLDVLDAMQIEVTARPGGVARVVRGDHNPQGPYFTSYSLNPSVQYR